MPLVIVMRVLSIGIMQQAVASPVEHINQRAVSGVISRHRAARRAAVRRRSWLFGRRGGGGAAPSRSTPLTYIRFGTAHNRRFNLIVPTLRFPNDYAAIRRFKGTR